MADTVLVLPGIGNSGPEHWQTLWEQQHRSFVRVQQHDWDHPVCEEWMQALEHTARGIAPNVVLVAHSLACLLVAHWAASTRLQIKGALLVAPPDPDGPEFPREARGFTPLPQSTFSFPSILVASTNDPYGSFEFAASLAHAWGSQLVNVGPVGHINSSSGLREWSEGLGLLRQLTK